MVEVVREIELEANSEQVSEVISFINDGQLLSKSAQISRDSSVLLDLSDAQNLAWNSVYGEDELTWTDIRAEKMAEVWEVIYADEHRCSDIEDLISSVLQEVSDKIESKLGERHSELLDDVVADLMSCLYSRASCGLENTFFEALFDVYKHGGWPCGWVGEWPEGQLAVYVRGGESNK